MRIEHYPLKKLETDIIGMISQYLDVSKYKVFFFGSRVSGRGNEYSDIDVGIEGPAEVPFAAMSRIREDMENLPILYKIEVVDFKNVSSDFYEVASFNREYL